MTMSYVESPLRELVRKGSGRLMWLGAAFTLIGVGALVFPMFSTLVATLFVGWMLIFLGAVTLAGAFTIRGAGPFFGALLYALLAIAAGVYLVAQPSTGALAIALVLGAVFMVQGAFELALAFELRRTPGWGWFVASGLASALLSIAILVGLPGTSLVLLGILIGVNFISTGIAYLILGGAAKREVSA
jgi:uncharacterized membrane protein HdeD (DUF308 family)